MSACLHTVRFGNLCGECGRDLVKEADGPPHGAHGDTGGPLARALHSREDVWVDRGVAAEGARAEYHALLSGRRMALVMDIDHTMLHAVSARSVHKPPQHVHVLDVQGTLHLIKLRPGIARFLRDSQKLFQLHVYTHGSRGYAAAVMKLLDPTGGLFSDRVVSRDDCDANSRKTLGRIFPYKHNHVVVVDDSRSVWSAPHPVLKVPRYVYFGKSSTGGFSEEDTEEADGRTLQKTSRILKGLHAKFFAKEASKGDANGTPASPEATSHPAESLGGIPANPPGAAGSPPSGQHGGGGGGVDCGPPNLVSDLLAAEKRKRGAGGGAQPRRVVRRRGAAQTAAHRLDEMLGGHGPAAQGQGAVWKPADGGEGEGGEGEAES